MLKETLVQMGVDTHLLDMWYQKDSNAVPPVFILQPISSILFNFNNKVTDGMLKCQMSG
jgi:hypothetical protein